jgi:hypothetical protein
LQINSLAVRLGLESDVANSRFTAAYARLHGDGDWLAGELSEDVSRGSAESPAVDSEDSDASKSAHESNKSHESNGSHQSHGAGTAEGAGVGDSSGVNANGAVFGSHSAEAERTISRRFSWMARTASAMRRDCRRFVADSSPPAG